MFSISLLLAWSALFTFSQASPLYTKFLQKRASGSIPLPPSVDPFYTGPTNYQLAAPGALLRVREAPGNLTSVIGNCSAAYNILYRTTDSHYQPTWAVTTLFVPLLQPNTTSIASNSTSPGGALLSYQIAYDSADVDSSPSYTLYSGGWGDITNGLGSGWFVNVPDYDGPLGLDVAGVQSGHATLDSVRAVLSSGFSLSSNARYVIWGYSGGALASE
jgi:Secretory lipase